MKKITLVAAVAAAIASPAFAVSYNALATSGTAADPNASMNVDVADIASSLISVKKYYVSDAAGTASDKSNVGVQAAVQLIRQSDWTFDFTDLNHVAFTGNIQLGNYKVQSNMAGLFIVDARERFVGVTQSFSGVGTYDVATNTFTYIQPLSATNTGGASVQTQTSSGCTNGATANGAKLCSNILPANPNWEGLALNFVFSEPGGQFTGSVTGIDNLYNYSVTYNWLIASPSSVPIPAAAWLFGSSLVGLIGAARRQKTAL